MNLELDQALKKIENMDIGEAKKIRLKSVVRRRYALAKEDKLSINLKRLSRFSRADLSKIGKGLKSISTATNSGDLIKREFGIEV